MLIVILLIDKTINSVYYTVDAFYHGEFFRMK